MSVFYAQDMWFRHHNPLLGEFPAPHLFLCVDADEVIGFGYGKDRTVSLVGTKVGHRKRRVLTRIKAAADCVLGTDDPITNTGHISEVGAYCSEKWSIDKDPDAATEDEWDAAEADKRIAQILPSFQHLWDTRRDDFQLVEVAVE